ncbi:hypothetical protein [Fimbriiglobus ruber]|uniref:Uncharacterized protein n=1 Tax=Fimbriiglobus ruber TaxID=1908690 RepID=A0A225D5F8_9BACT|nr:hypothetical protein [Fimbriiglobus ruber]OWK34864.1 hypothetical protein FRUB_09706 [Fimbriiglobus ruber]
MATVLTTPATARPKFDSQVEQELGKAASRIRLNDVLTGALSLAVLTLGYVTLAVIFDRWLDLPGWLRQTGLFALLATLFAVGYVLIVRPVRRTVNPRFAARLVEATIPDAKNALINWVDLKDTSLSDGVRAAVGARAARGVGDADLHKATEARRILWLGAMVGLLLATLAALFVFFKPAPFLSLVGRTFNPFSSTRIATRTEITIKEPEGGNAIVTTGDPLTIAVYIGGSVPDPTSSDRVRLIVRHDPESADFDEFPLEQAGAAREWVARVPQSVIQNGFWYKVAANDAMTAEYRVEVRSRSLFKEFEVRYEYPEYTRMKPETGREPRLEGYRGTRVTLITKTNRQVRRGWLQLEGQSTPIPGEVVGERKDALQFRLVLEENTSYRLGFTSLDGETSEPTPPYPVRVLVDQAPTVTIAEPTQDEIALPTNSTLKIDGAVGDDFGIASVVLKMEVIEGTTRTTVAAKPYRDGKPLRRESDGSYPMSLEYKDSVSLVGLKQPDGKPVVLEPRAAIEYWLEATDNCAPKANVGKSKVKRVVLREPVVEKEQQAQIQKDQQERKANEKRHQQQQDKQLQNEKRDPKQLHPDQKADQPKDGQQGDEPGAAGEKGTQGASSGQQQGGGQEKSPMGGGQERQPGGPDQPPMGGGQENQPGGAAKPPMAGGSQENQPGGAAKPPMTGGQEKPPMAGGSEKPPMAGGPDQPPMPKQPNPSNGNDPAAKPDTTPKPETGAENPGAAGSPMKTDPGTKQKDEQEAKKVNEAIKEQQRKDRQPGETRGQNTDGDKNPDNVPAQPKKGPQESTAPKAPGESPDSAKPKPMPGQEGADPTNPDQTPGASKPEGKPMPSESGGTGQPKPEAGGSGKPNEGQQNSDQKGREKPAPDDPDRQLAREFGDKNSGGSAPTKADMEVQRLARKAENELASENPEVREKAEKDFEATLSKKDREQLKRAAQDAKSGDAQKKQQAKKDIDELAKKASKNEEWNKKAQDLNSPDQEKADAARRDFDKTIGQDERKELEKDQKNAQSGNGDPDAKERAQEKVQRAANNAGNPSGQSGGEKNQPTKEEIDELVKKAKDLNSNDPEKRAAAEKALDEKIGSDNRKQLQKDMKSGGSDEQDSASQRAEQTTKDAAKQQKGGGGEPTKEDIEKAKQLAQDLNSSDKDKRAAAEEQLDKAIGQEKRKELQQDIKQEQARQRIEQGAKDAAKQQNGGGGEPSKEDMEKAKQLAQDLNSSDKDKKAAAEEKFDKAVGQEKRKQLQQDMKDAQSGDPAKQEQARQRIEQGAKDAAKQQNGGGGGEPSKEDIEKAKQLAQDLNSSDKDKKAAAEEKIDKAIGQEKRKQLQQDMKDAQSGDPAKQDAARQRAEQATKDAAKNQRSSGEPSKEDVEKAKQMAEDLASPDENKRKNAEKEFDKAIGKEGREQMRKDIQDKKSSDAAKEQAAREQIEKMAKDQQAKNEQGGARQQQPSPDKTPSKEDVAKRLQQAPDLASDDKQTREKAEQALDQDVGKDRREQMQKAAQDKKNAGQSGDMAKEKQAQDKIEQMAKDAPKGQGGDKGKTPSKEELEKLVQAAKDLNSPDKEKKAEAEKKFDDLVGKEAREQAQQKAKKLSEDLKSGDPAKQKAAQKELEELANNLSSQSGSGPQTNNGRPGGAGKEEEAKLHQDDPKNRLKTAELQLTEFEKNRENKELQNKLGYTPEDYERFLQAQRKRVEEMRAEADQAALNPNAKPTGPAELKVGDASGGVKTTTRSDGTGLTTGGSGPGIAPPGYSDPQKKFAEAASRSESRKGHDKATEGNK